MTHRKKVAGAPNIAAAEANESKPKHRLRKSITITIDASVLSLAKIKAKATGMNLSRFTEQLYRDILHIPSMRSSHDE